MKAVYVLLAFLFLLNIESIAQITVQGGTVAAPNDGSRVLYGSYGQNSFTFDANDVGMDASGPYLINITSSDSRFTLCETSNGTYSSSIAIITDDFGSITGAVVYFRYTPDKLSANYPSGSTPVTTLINVADELANYSSDQTVSGIGKKPITSVKGGAAWSSIADGSTAINTTIGTDFGSADYSSGTVDHDFRVQNTNATAHKGDLVLSGTPKVSISGTNPGDFSVTVQPTSPIAPDNAYSVMTIRFDPTTTGTRTATIHITTNDPLGTRDDYNFDVQGVGTATAPSTQASSVSFSGLGTTGLTASWTRGNGSNCAVFMYAGSSGTAAPVDATTYTANTIFGSGTQIGSSGWFCIYNGTGTSVAVTGLTENTPYRVMVCEYNGSGTGTLYNVSTATNNPNNQTTLKTAPALQVTDIVFTNVRGSTMDISWTQNGTCDGHIVALKASSAISILPVNNTTYNASSVFMAGDVVGPSGQSYCVYNGAGTSVSVTGLTAGVTYYCRIYQYNNAAGYEQYNTNTATNNPKSQVMATAVPPLLSATNISSSNFYANWQTVAGADKYYLDVSTVSDFSSFVTGYNNLDVGNVSTKNVNSGLTAGSTYYYRVRSYSTSTLLTSDDASSPMTVTIKCSAPVAISATAITGDSFTANWNAVSGADDYRFDVSNNVGFTSFEAGYQDLTVAGTSQFVTGLTPNTTYYYRVRASNSAGVSNNSNTITVTTLNEYTWTGTVSTVWNLAGNWNAAAIPTSSVSVRIPNVANDPVISASATCNDLSILTGALLTISASGGNLTVSGNTTIDGTILVDAGPGGISGSLITNGTLTNNGTVQMKVAMSKGAVSPFTRWHCVSSPITDAVTATVYANSMPNRYKYDETSASSYWVAADASMTVGKGYYVAYNANKYQTFSSSGNFNNSAVAGIPLSFTPAGRNGFNLIGNPFPCSLDWESGAWSLTNVGTTIQIKNGDSYATFTQGGAGTNGGTRYIQPGQGFFVVASAATSITIPTGARVHNTSGTLLKTISPLSFIRFNLSDATLSSESIIMFDDNATTEFDSQVDAYKMFSDNVNTPEIYCLTPVNNDTLVVDAVPLNANLVKPLGVKIKNAGTYTIKANMINAIDPAIPLYLEDTETGTYTNLRVDSSYSFTISLSDYNVSNRFNLRFSAAQAMPAITSQSVSNQYCAGDIVSLAVAATGSNPTYQWHNSQGSINGATTSSYLFTDIAEIDADTYYCVVSNDFGSVQSNNIVITVKTPVSVSQQPASSVICQGQNSTIDVIVNGTNPTYQWQKDGADIIGQTASILSLDNSGLSDAGNYTCIITNSCNSVTTDPATIAVTELPVVDLGATQNICVGSIVTLDAGNTGATYAWSDMSANQTVDVNSTGTYSVVVTKDGCSSSDEVVINVNSYPNVDLGNDISVCTGVTVLLDAGNTGSTYLWNNQSVNQVLSVTTSGTFNVAVTKDGCTANDEIVVTFNPYPVVNLGNTQNVCEGTTVTLDAGNAGATYLWNDNSTNQQLNVTSANSYEVTVTNNGCASTGSVTINYKPTPYIDLGSDISVCQGTSLTLDAGYITGNSYSWSTGSHNQIISPTSSGIYAVTVTNNGCSASDNISITITSNPIVNLGNDQILCGNTNVMLDAGLAAAYVWSTGETTQTISVSQSGTYAITVSDNSCTGSDAVTITFKPTPVVDLGTDVSVCEGQNVTLDAGYITGNTYTWSTGSHNEIISPVVSGLYSVTVTNNGCSGTDEVAITINSNPVVDLGADIEICSGCIETLDAGNTGSTYLWSTGATTQTIDVSVSGTYSVTVTSSGGCTDIDEIIVDITSGVEENPLFSTIELYPNPAVNSITVATGIVGSYNIDIVDLTGKVVYTVQTDKNQNEINISTLEKGVYLMRISDSNNMFVKTFVKQ